MSQQNFRRCLHCGLDNDPNATYCGRCRYQFTHYGTDDTTFAQHAPATPIDNMIGATIPTLYPHPITPKKQTTIRIVFFATLAVLLIGALILGINLGKGGTTTPNNTGNTSTIGNVPTSGTSSAQGNTTPTTVIPSPTTPPPTSVPAQQGTILCQDWSKWTLSSHWSVLNGVLINDGNDSYTNWLTAPCQPSTKDYAVESEMKIDQGCNAHGVVARAVGPNNYAAGAYCLGGDVEIWLWGNNANTHQDLAHHNLSIGTAWHTYRFEVKGNELKLLIDGTVMCDVIDDTILSEAGQVGIWDQNEQLEVRSFKIIVL